MLNVDDVIVQNNLKPSLDVEIATLYLSYELHYRAPQSGAVR